LLDLNPISWLAGRKLEQRRYVQVVTAAALLGVASLLIAGLLLNQRMSEATSVLNFCFRSVLQLAVGWQACAMLAAARHSGELEQLLATPITDEQIRRGQWQALHRTFFWPVLIAVAIGFVPVVDQLLRAPPSGMNLVVLPLPAVATYKAITFVLDLIATAWVGIWMGLSQGKPVPAFLKTILYVMIVPALVFCLPNILFDVFWISWAHGKLSRDVRRVSAEYYSRPREPVSSIPAPPRILAASH
jgi:hypothetical protein